jgi:Papain family cysteine protease
MHAALNEVGVLYVSCGCHSGWDEGVNQPTLAQRPASIADVWQIPIERGSAAHAGHAFAIVGYDERGFLVQNSWGSDWGSHGYAILGYEDWIANAMDCWVAQLGVVTAEHRELSQRATLKMSGSRVALAASTVLRNRELSPYIVNMGNDGQLSASGQFRTTPDDLRALAGPCLDRAREQWGLQDGPVDVCIFAHGGLVDETAAAEVAARWIPKLYENRILPVFLMWETGFLDTLGHLLEDALRGQPRAAGAGGGFERWWNSRLESALAKPGTLFWREMKENADLISRYRDKNADGTAVADDAQAGAVLLYRHFKHQVKNRNVRMHFVGHSAGAIVGAPMIARMVADGMKLESCSFMAPALRLDEFDRLVAPLVEGGQIGRYQQFSLTDRAEEDDSSCGPYRRSLLCLVSEAFEGSRGTPILGLERFAKARLAELPRTTVHWAPGRNSTATTHGGFDEDEATTRQVLRFIRSA